MTVEEAYKLMRNPQRLLLTERLACHEVMLVQAQPINKDRMMAEALADLCKVARNWLETRK